MKHCVIAAFFLAIFPALLSFAAAEEETFFASMENKENFAKDLSTAIEKAWKAWQDSVRINGIEVESSQGILPAGRISKPNLNARDIMANFNKTDKPQGCIDTAKIVAKTMENSMRAWQRGYSHENIPFPQGASCCYTLTPCDNVAVTVASGKSSGSKNMTENALYNHMIYQATGEDKDNLTVFRGAALAISECFEKWGNTCFIKDIRASGGIAPAPAPMGTGPGPVRGAKGNDGKLAGSYFDGSHMYAKMVEFFREKE